MRSKRTRRLFFFIFLADVVLGGSFAFAQQGEIVSSLQFRGNENLNSAELKTQMFTKATAWYDFLPYVEPRRFDAGLFHSDLQRLHAYYQTQGFYYTNMDTVLYATKPGHISLEINIQEGPRSFIEQIRISGLDTLQDKPKEVNHLLELKGEAFVRDELSVQITSLIKRLRNLGFGFAKAELSSYADSLKVYAEVEISLGPICEISEIDVQGNKGVSKKTVLRGLTFKTGERFEGKALEDSRRQLYRAGVFRSVLVELPDTAAQNTPILIRVSERPFKSITLGGGFDTEIGLRAEAAWLHRNFGGGARQLRISSTLSTETRELVLGVRQPYFFSSRNWLNLSGFVQKRFQADVAQDEVGASTTFERNLAENLDLVIKVSGGFVGPQTDSTFSEVRASLQWDSRNDLFDPTEGALASLTVRERGWWLRSDWEFWEINAEGRLFQPLPFNTVLGLRILGGRIFRINSRAEVPLIERYYSGGLNSVRGWAYEALGPKTVAQNDAGDPYLISLGGTSHLEGSVELRVRIMSFLGTAFFVDAGNVSDQGKAFSIVDLKWAVGAGLRILTPVGPIRFDGGYRLSDDPILDNTTGIGSRWQFHLSLGQAF